MQSICVCETCLGWSELLLAFVKCIAIYVVHAKVNWKTSIFSFFHIIFAHLYVYRSYRSIHHDSFRASFSLFFLFRRLLHSRDSERGSLISCWRDLFRERCDVMLLNSILWSSIAICAVMIISRNMIFMILIGRPNPLRRVWCCVVFASHQTGQCWSLWSSSFVSILARNSLRCEGVERKVKILSLHNNKVQYFPFITQRREFLAQTRSSRDDREFSSFLRTHSTHT